MWPVCSHTSTLCGPSLSLPSGGSGGRESSASPGDSGIFTAVFVYG